MAASVIDVQKLSGTGGSAGLKPTETRDRDIYLVTLSEPATNPRSLVLGASYGGVTVPSIGDAHPVTGLPVARVDFDPEDPSTPEVYRVTVEYGQSQDADGLTGGTEPWSRADRVTRRPVVYEEAVSVDSEGNKYVNGAGDPFADPLIAKKRNSLKVIMRRRRKSDFDPNAAEACMDKLNDSAITLDGESIPALQAVLHSVETRDAVWSDGTPYYEISLEIEVERSVSLRYKNVQNKGFVVIEGGKRVAASVPMTDGAGNEIKGLDGQSLRVPVASSVFLTSSGASTTTPETKQFTVRTSSTWTWLS
jgi:hypothetical protein